MTSNRRTAMFSSFLIACGSLSLQANLINNGSFETVSGAPVAAGGFNNYFAGSTAITGWKVVGPEVNVVSGTFVSGCCTFPAEDPTPQSQWLDLTGDVNVAEGIVQTVATSPGTQYNLSFWVGNIFDPTGVYGTTSTVKVFLGERATLFFTATNSSTTAGTLTWQQFATSFTASGAVTTLTFINGDPASDNANGLDNVVLTALGKSAVPEPGSLWLLGAGLIGLATFRRRWFAVGLVKKS